MAEPRRAYHLYGLAVSVDGFAFCRDWLYVEERVATLDHLLGEAGFKARVHALEYGDPARRAALTATGDAQEALQWVAFLEAHAHRHLPRGERVKRIMNAVEARVREAEERRIAAIIDRPRIKGAA